MNTPRSARTRWIYAFLPTTALAVFCIVCVAGCGKAAVNPEIAKYRTGLLMSNEPEAAMSIEDARDQLEATDALVTIEGMADMESLQATGQRKALMLVRELLPNDHGHQSGHDPSSCPFCKRRMAKAPKAAVEFVGDDGQVLPYPVDELFELKQGDLVIVRGTAKLDAGLDVMKVTASGIYVRDRN